MGIEFIRKAAKPFRRLWDEGRKALGTAGLFTEQPTPEGRSAPFDLAPDASLNVGDVVVVEAEGESLIARQRLHEVARIINPPAELLQAVQQSSGVAKGTIDQVHMLSRVAEISVC